MGIALQDIKWHAFTGYNFTEKDIPRFFCYEKVIVLFGL